MFRIVKQRNSLAIVVVAVIIVVGLGLFFAKNDGSKENSNKHITASSQDIASNEDEEISSRLQGAKASCGITPATGEGAYYIAGIAELKEGLLNYGNFEGEPIKISGYVLAGADNSTPIEGAKVEIWQADNSGKYHPEGSGVISQYEASQLNLRGFVTTDKYGYYEFTSIIPGESESRARHINIRASADGYKAVATQAITPLSGDPVAVSADPVAASLPSCNILAFTDDYGIQAAQFNLNLAKL